MAMPEDDAAGIDAVATSDPYLARYREEIAIYEREASPWESRAQKITQRYKAEQGVKNPKKRLNLLWANVQTMLPALYLRDPKADISKRFNASGLVGRFAAMALEKVVNYFIHESNFSGHNGALRKAVRGYVLPGRGTAWVRYVPHIQNVPVDPDNDGDEHGAEVKQGTEDQGPEITDNQAFMEEVHHEEVAVDFVHYEDFGHNICRTWEEVYLVWRRVYMDRSDLKKRFGKEEGEKVSLDYQPKTSKGGNLAVAVPKAVIYECWDKKRKKAFWLHKEGEKFLDVRDDPLKLEKFFPTPEPLLANLADDTLIPTPDFVQWQDQANDVDSMTAKISSLLRALKVAGVYDQSAEGVDRLLSEGVQNKLLPVQQWMAFAEKGGLSSVIDFLPMEEISKVVTDQFEARDKLKAEVYEITGMTDIMRGATDPEETYGAQQLKDNYTNLRLSDRQHRVHEYARDVVRIMAEIVAMHFSIATIKQISDMRLFDNPQQKQLAQQNPQIAQALFPDASQEELEEIAAAPTWDQIEQLLKNNPGRSFKLDIETNSTIRVDEQQEKNDRTELLKAVGAFIASIENVAEKSPVLVPLLCRLLEFGVRAFPVGKELEEAFTLAIAKLEKMAANPQPKPDPVAQKIQGEQQIEAMKQQFAIQSEQARVQADAQIEANRAQTEQAMERMRLEYQERAEESKQRWQQWQTIQQNRVEQIAHEQETRMDMLAQRFKTEMEGQIKVIVAHISAAASIEVARIGAAASDGGEAENREASGEQ